MLSAASAALLTHATARTAWHTAARNRPRHPAGTYIQLRRKMFIFTHLFSSRHNPNKFGFCTRLNENVRTLPPRLRARRQAAISRSSKDAVIAMQMHNFIFAAERCKCYLYGLYPKNDWERKKIYCCPIKLLWYPVKSLGQCAATNDFPV